MPTTVNVAAADGTTVAIQQRINNVTFADLGASSPITFTTSGDLTVSGTTTLGANYSIISAGFSRSGHTILDGVVSGGKLIKIGTGMLDFNNSGNTFGTDNQVSLEVWGSTQNTATSMVVSMVRTGTPFGVGDIKLNPGTMIRLFDASNIATQKVTAASDDYGLSGLGIGYNIRSPNSPRS